MNALAKRFLPLVIVLLVIIATFAGVLLQQGTATQSFMAVSQLLLMGGVAAASLTAYIFYERARRASKEKSELLNAIAHKDALLDFLPDSYILFSPQGQVLKSAGLDKLLGAEKLTIAQDFYDTLEEASVEKIQESIKYMQKGEMGFRLQLVVRKDAKTLLAQGVRYAQHGQAPAVLVWLRDISELAGEISRQSEGLQQTGRQLQELKLLLGSLSFPMWQRDKNLKLTWCNEAYARAVGASAFEVTNNQVELVPATQRGKGKTLAEAARDEGVAQQEDRHVVIDGERHLLSITEMPVGSEKKIIGFAVDISREAELDGELKQHIKAHQEVLEQLGTAIAIYGADMRLKFFNRAYLKLWDSDEEFLHSEPTFSEILEDLRTRRRAPEQADFQKYKKERLALFTSLIDAREDLMHLPDGTALRIMAVPHPFGGIMFMHEDVTDKLALESSYNTLIAVQRETLDHLAEGVLVCGSDGKIRLYNPAFLKVWKLEDAQMAEHPHLGDVLEMMKPLLPSNDWAVFKRDTLGEILERVTRTGTYERTDGAVIEYSCIPLPDGAVLISYLDVSDKVLAEQALRETNIALAAADKLKSEFVANVSYQLRTPLNTIMGFAEILTNQYFGALNEKQLEYARTIMEASKKLLHLINDVLDMATIEAGRMALNPKVIPVRSLLDGAVEMTRDWARQQNLHVMVKCDDKTGSFEADEQRMRQVMFNLMSNAIQYTPAGGHITLTAERQGEWVMLAIEDDGMGIPEEDQKRVFEKFERANPQARQQGAGLGLALVRSFIELHGGRLHIDSQKEHGTKITCLLPLKPAA